MVAAGDVEVEAGVFVRAGRDGRAGSGAAIEGGEMVHADRGGCDAVEGFGAVADEGEEGGVVGWGGDGRNGGGKEDEGWAHEEGV